jgi:hypothetical protein
LLDDANALTSYLPEKVAVSIRWKANESILFGAGNGIPLGCMNGGAIVTVAKESGQATQTLLTQNLAKMIARLPPGSFTNAVWIVNNDVLPALFTLTLGNYPIYLPVGQSVGGIQLSPYGTLLGRPVFVSQHANTFSSQGDVLLVDLSYYQTITKAGGMQTATSMHLYFDADLTAFRTTFRMDGQSKIHEPDRPGQGSQRALAVHPARARDRRGQLRPVVVPVYRRHPCTPTSRAAKRCRFSPPSIRPARPPVPSPPPGCRSPTSMRFWRWSRPASSALRPRPWTPRSSRRGTPPAPAPRTSAASRSRQIVKASGDNKQALINLRPENLDSNNGFAFLRLSLTVEVAASLVAGKLIGVHPRYATAEVFNQAAVVQAI